MYHRVEISQAHCLNHAALSEWYMVESGGGYIGWIEASHMVQRQVYYFYNILGNIRPHISPLGFHLSEPWDGAR